MGKRGTSTRVWELPREKQSSRPDAINPMVRGVPAPPAKFPPPLSPSLSLSLCRSLPCSSRPTRVHKHSGLHQGPPTYLICARAVFSSQCSHLHTHTLQTRLIHRTGITCRIMKLYPSPVAISLDTQDREELQQHVSRKSRNRLSISGCASENHRFPYTSELYITGRILAIDYCFTGEQS
ncbi:hypothetical protein KQX54_020029 [Cotesia glomerata]|uniref:Uncharacterized protein n=1 Tax=Cotesia glomerata TaxID=32391 RepID=A0AAV7IFK1_COTGL|nr:hypothetical protein KQX54_020029 [Cotesia glomerata]